MAKQPGKAPSKPRNPRAPAPSAEAISIAAHPRATYAITRAKGAGGLLGVLLVALLSWRAGAPLLDAGVRALAGGAVGYVACWALAVLAWRHVVIAEVRAVERRARELAAERDRAAEANG
jgi:hypothetical protein